MFASCNLKGTIQEIIEFIHLISKYDLDLGHAHQVIMVEVIVVVIL